MQPGVKERGQDETHWEAWAWGILLARRMDGSTRDNTEKKQEGVESGPMNSSLQAGVGEKQPAKERRGLRAVPKVKEALTLLLAGASH